MQFKRHLHLGEVELPWSAARHPIPIFVTVECEPRERGDRLSFTGVTGPTPNGNSKGNAGQIDITAFPFVSYGEGWDFEKVNALAELWERWHMNDARPWCEHQYAEGWHKRLIDPSMPPTWSNMLAWVRRTGDGGPSYAPHHPEGLLAHPCDVCGYKYGTAWLYEPVPGDVLESIRNLPAGSRTLPKAWQ